MSDVPPFSEWADFEGMDADEPEDKIKLGTEDNWEEFLVNMTTVTKNLLDRLGEHSPATLEHSKRVASYSALMARCLKLDDKDRFTVESGALLHDIGILDVPAEILENPHAYEEVNHKNPETLSQMQYEQLRGHTSAGYSIILDKMPFPPIAEVASYHHEHLDGSGYLGRTYKQIPLAAMVIAVADTYDMMTEMYEEKRSPEEAMEELKALADTKYDDVCVKALEFVLEALERI